MNKKDGLEKLAQQMTQITAGPVKTSIPEGQDTIILARMIDGVSCKDLQKACQSGELTDWHVLPVNRNEQLDEMETPGGQTLTVSPFCEAYGALTSTAFLRLLKCELMRLHRNGGSLSLISAAIVPVNPENSGRDRHLEGLLGSTLLKHLENCDSLGILRQGQFLCCLPGLGQLAARNFAEKTQKEFTMQANSGDEQKNISCAMGIVNLVQGESGVAKELVKRAKYALEMALSKKSANIYQESSLNALENTTLVQSSEKRFLFFGGSAS